MTAKSRNAHRSIRFSNSSCQTGARSSGSRLIGRRVGSERLKSAPFWKSAASAPPPRSCRRNWDETTKRADRRDADHSRAAETLQAQLGYACHRAGVLPGRLDAVQARNVTLQEQLAVRHAADGREMRPVHPKATTRSTAARLARATGSPRKAPATLSSNSRRRRSGQSMPASSTSTCPLSMRG